MEKSMKASEQKTLMMNSGFERVRKEYSDDVHSELEENITVEWKGWAGATRRLLKQPCHEVLKTYIGEHITYWHSLGLE